MLPAAAIVSNVDAKFKVVNTATTASEGRIQAYNIDGQADPNADAGSTVYTRCKDDTTPYISGNTLPDSIAVVTITIAADAEVEAAIDTPDRFSLGWTYTSAETFATEDYLIETIEAAGADEPKLVVTHTLPDTVAHYAYPMRVFG